MIDHELQTKTPAPNNTLITVINDSRTQPMREIKYDALFLFNPKPYAWFFHDIETYVQKSSGHPYKNILLLGCSKSANAAIAIAHELTRTNTYEKTLVWAFSPTTKITWSQSIKDQKQRNLSPQWDKVKDDTSIKEKVEYYGDVNKLVNCKFNIMYSYSHNEDWTFDKEGFESIRNKDCIREDQVECTEELMNLSNSETYENIHNTLRYYWKARRELFYEKLEKFITDNTLPQENQNTRPQERHNIQPKTQDQKFV